MYCQTFGTASAMYSELLTVHFGTPNADSLLKWKSLGSMDDKKLGEIVKEGNNVAHSASLTMKFENDLYAVLDAMERCCQEEEENGFPQPRQEFDAQKQTALKLVALCKQLRQELDLSFQDIGLIKRKPQFVDYAIQVLKTEKENRNLRFGEECQFGQAFRKLHNLA